VWSRAWVEERGRPEFATAVRFTKDNRIQRLTITMNDPLRRGLVWPQRMRVTLGYAGAQKDLSVYANAATTTVREAAGMPKPLFVLPNGGGLGYGLFVLDEGSAGYLLANMQGVPDALTRGAAWVTLWDNVLEGRIAAGTFIDAAVRALPGETDEQNTQRILGYLSRAYWRWLPGDRGLRARPRLKRAARRHRARRDGQSQVRSGSARFETTR
jgi:aminopeptidase N